MTSRSMRPASALTLGFLSGWISFLAIHAALIFIVPHGPGFAPEVGPFGAFVIFGIIFSLFYVADFVIIAIPAYFQLYPVLSAQHWRSALWGAGLFAFSVPFWSVAYGHYELLEILSCAAVATAPGAVTFYVLSKLRNAAGGKT